MAQRFLRFFGQSRTQKAVYEALKDFLKKLNGFGAREKAIQKLEEMQRNILNKTKNEESERLITNENSKENKETQKTKNKGIFTRKWGSEKKGLSTYNFLKKFCELLEKSEDISKLTEDVKTLKKILSKSAAINTNRSLKLIDEIAKEISKKDKSISFKLRVCRFETVEKKSLENIGSNDKINEKFFTEKLGYPKDKCSGVKICAKDSSQPMLEIKDNFLNIERPYKEIFENNKAYDVYFLVDFLVTIEGKDNEEKKTSFYTDMNSEEVYEKLKKEFNLNEDSELLINGKLFSESKNFDNLIHGNEQSKIFIKTTKDLYKIIYNNKEIEIKGSSKISSLSQKIIEKFGEIRVWKIISGEEVILSSNKITSDKSVKDVFQKNKECILKTSETYQIGICKFEIPLWRKINDELSNFNKKSGTTNKSNYMITDRIKAVLIVQNGKVTSGNGGKPCSEVFDKKINYAIRSYVSKKQTNSQKTNPNIDRVGTKIPNYQSNNKVFKPKSDTRVEDFYKKNFDYDSLIKSKEAINMVEKFKFNSLERSIISCCFSLNSGCKACNYIDEDGVKDFNMSQRKIIAKMLNGDEWYKPPYDLKSFVGRELFVALIVNGDGKTDFDPIPKSVYNQCNKQLTRLKLMLDNYIPSIEKFGHDEFEIKFIKEYGDFDTKGYCRAILCCGFAISQNEELLDYGGSIIQWFGTISPGHHIKEAKIFLNRYFKNSRLAITNALSDNHVFWRLFAGSFSCFTDFKKIDTKLSRLIHSTLLGLKKRFSICSDLSSNDDNQKIHELIGDDSVIEKFKKKLMACEAEQDYDELMLDYAETWEGYRTKNKFLSFEKNIVRINEDKYISMKTYNRIIAEIKKMKEGMKKNNYLKKKENDNPKYVQLSRCVPYLSFIKMLPDSFKDFSFEQNNQGWNDRWKWDGFEDNQEDYEYSEVAEGKEPSEDLKGKIEKKLIPSLKGKNITITQLGFMSTSKIANDRLSEYGNVALEIKILQKHYDKYFGYEVPETAKYNENEVIFAPGTKFKIVDAKTETSTDGKNVYFLVISLESIGKV